MIFPQPVMRLKQEEMKAENRSIMRGGMPCIKGR